MPLEKLENLMKSIDSIEAAGITVNVQKGSQLHDEIKSMDRSITKRMAKTD